MGIFDGKGQGRIADALEELLRLYKLDLAYRGINTSLDVEGEGEIFTTDDDDVAARIERIKRSGIPHPGFYLGEEPEGILNPDGSPRGEEVQAGRDYSAVLGPGWGLNVGPEGAEESGAGPDSYRSS